MKAQHQPNFPVLMSAVAGWGPVAGLLGAPTQSELAEGRGGRRL